MKQQAQQLWTLLQQSKIVEGEFPQAGEKLQSPWYVKVLLGFSGWIASLFLLIFLGLILNDVFDNSPAGLLSGAFVIGISYALLYRAKNEFIEHLALAFSLAGQALLIFSLYGFVDDDNALFWMLVVLLQAGLAILMPNFLHRVLTSAAATCSFSILMARIGLPQLSSGTLLLIAVMCWVNEFRWVRFMSAMRAIGYGVILAMLLFRGSLIYGIFTNEIFSIYQTGEVILPYWVGIVLLTLVMLYLVWNILQRYYASMLQTIPVTAFLATLLLCAASIEMPGLNVSLAILLLGFLGSNRILMGLGTVSLLFFMSSYYYFMHVTLLDKSQALFFIAIALLILRWLMLNILTRKKEAEHA